MKRLMVLALGTVALLSASAEMRAITPVSRTDNGWMELHQKKLAEIAANSNGTYDVVFVGDSIVGCWEQTHRGRWAHWFKYGKIRALNLGFGGDRTEHALWRVQNGELDGYKAKCIMLMIGTNNTWHRSDDANHIAEGIRRILDVMRAKQPQAKIVLLPIFPFGENAQNAKRVNNEKVNAIIKGYADDKDIFWSDFNAQFLDEKGDMIKSAQDRCHPTAEAYRDVWVPNVLPLFRKFVGK